MNSPAEVAAKQLAWDMESRKSVEVRFTYGMVNGEPDPSQPKALDTIVEHYIETAAGQKFYDFRGMKGDAITYRSTHFGDGAKFTDINYDSKNIESQQLVYVKREFWMEEGSDRRQLPKPLLFLYVGRVPLYKALPKAEYLGKGEVIGRECNLFLFPQVRWFVTLDQVFYLDQATSVPLKVEAFRDQASREKKEPLWVWTAQSLDKVQGHFVPLKSTQTSYLKDGSPETTWDFHVESIEFDKEYPASTFTPVFQPGVTVLDGFTNKTYEAPGVKKAVVNPPKATATTGQPIQAIPPRDWSASAPILSLGLGAVILIVAGLLWRRSR